MFKRSFVTVGATLLVLAALIFSAGQTVAQHHSGGGQGSGGHGWSGGGSQGHPGYYGGYGWGNPSYYRGDYYYPGYYGYGGYGRYGYPYYGNYGYGYYPNYGYYNYRGNYYGATYSYGAYSAPATDEGAHMRVIVPPDAQIWFDGTPTTQTGSVRSFDSPPLTPGRRFTYEIRAQWREDGRDVTQTRRVAVHAGDAVTVDFTQPEEGR
jgi:uncharacterized protein (TIGR03000 family)